MPSERPSAACVYEFVLDGTVCGSILSTEGMRAAMELWAADDLYARHVLYGEDTVTVNGVAYRVKVAP